jgi:hypothetical protein
MPHPVLTLRRELAEAEDALREKAEHEAVRLAAADLSSLLNHNPLLPILIDILRWQLLDLVCVCVLCENPVMP